MNEIVDIRPSKETLSRQRKSHVTEKQRTIMLDFMESHPAFQRGELVGIQGKTKQLELREQLSLRLNSCGDGIAKDPTRWMKSWTDWKNKVKSKAAAVKKHQRGTGGGSPLPRLSLLEDRLLQLMTIESVTGDEKLPEGGARQEPAQEADEFQIENMPIYISNDPENTSPQSQNNQLKIIKIAETPKHSINEPTCKKRNAEDEAQPSKSAKKTKKGNSTKDSEELIDSYLANEDHRLNLEREKFDLDKAVRSQEIELKKQELHLQQANSEAFVNFANKLAKLAVEMTKFFQKRNEELD